MGASWAERADSRCCRGDACCAARATAGAASDHDGVAATSAAGACADRHANIAAGTGPRASCADAYSRSQQGLRTAAGVDPAWIFRSATGARRSAGGIVS